MADLIKNSPTTNQVILDVCQEMLNQIGLVTQVKLINENGEIEIMIQDQEPGVLIGYHGDTLNAFQHLLKLIVFNKIGSWPNLVVEIAGYRKNREKILQSMAQSAVQRLGESGQPVKLPPLPPYERKIIHLFLAGYPEIITESEGEDRDRRVVVKQKSKS